MESFEIRVPASPSRGAPELVLSRPTEGDVERIAQICRDPDIQEWTCVPRDYSQQDAESFITEVVDPGWEDGTELTWGVREVDADGAVRLVGMLGVRTAVSGRGEIGFWLAPEARGRGTILRAARAVIDKVFDPQGPVGLAALGWACDIHDGVPNWDSWRVAWRLGFLKEARRRRYLGNKGELTDGWVATLLAEDPRQPRAPWDGPLPASTEPTGRGNGTSRTAGRRTPLVDQAGVGEREGDDPEALVRQFHKVYGLPVRVDGASLERESLHMRMGLVAEEFAELTGAVYGQAAREEIEAAFVRAVGADDGTRDTVEAADALADLVYVIYGMALETGIDLAAVLTEVQRSNMSKLGADGLPIYREDGKVLKGPDYFPPDVAGVLGL
ncbi:MAG: bifunctional GNAT family N-acetyltransferase/nucleoside triphosphate pyrophosphohydrolase family protein [Actinomyces sp.]|uniref:bifunctional GNAT family N-acetyltransferase/nucleoside triphosphate pyrophosphohydrolase family protein n=1 Tax=Actinomyces sp. TaxID=29317 RepID=UPI0026DD94EB|nr:bifunctional GNAT family N-acetyltransferase/nucleoside triphosphate pyrophosphohydrolase family protein [Actinomyces sp.]MDO4243453.1 bifunctional GNAT family N-acetyltransferase/nucleoside triphosphate pyrophosphohydrolase family protein [Actinomyces sp.]